MQNKYERRVNDHKHTQHKMLWVGMYADKKVTRELSYRTKAEERDRLKLERGGWK
jgi:hypothetical protein